ncbi:N-acetylmuramic acid 6-phosphate etherase [Anaerobranca gottschalkii]|uniref:N-acetylmuramic acid 6-phosphate etherase n=1 Tax=Anaerobranca gottschalkii DSM 13577 TaxID=1120990 RepID=A0A1I0AMP7_9FIRM|nr:N-acetylmuramic acid 6-phosphate etherase [Anaerobranca gottschalkii]SES95585.1 N-acetylmuramic acid 6-phosphate etherase [Anaerobranca gottschalkii DSM 13577]
MLQEISNLLTEQVNENTKDIDKKSTLEVLELINSEDKKVAYAVEEQLPKIAKVIDKIVTMIKKNGRIIYVGAGTSGRIAILDAAECPPTFGTPPELVMGIIAGGEKALTQAIEGVEDCKEEAVKQLEEINLNPKDVVIGLAASGRTPYVLGAIEYAKSLGCYTVGISCTQNSLLSRLADDGIEVIVGPEVVSGSTRLKAGTAQKMVLNMISTTTMILLGKVYGNLMVDVQPSNLKLKERAKKIVMESTGIDYKKAEEILESVNFNIKLAIIMVKTGCNKDIAEELLEESEGFIHKALFIYKNKRKGGKNESINGMFRWYV